jgi:hypothetical protein
MKKYSLLVGMNSKALLIIDVQTGSFTKQKPMNEADNLVGIVKSSIISSERKHKIE